MFCAFGMSGVMGWSICCLVHPFHPNSTCNYNYYFGLWALVIIFPSPSHKHFAVKNIFDVMVQNNLVKCDLLAPFQVKPESVVGQLNSVRSSVPVSHDGGSQCANPRSPCADFILGTCDNKPASHR